MKSSAPRQSKPLGFLAFFKVWADRQGWDVPDCHWRAVLWLERRGDLAVLRCFRGFGKSTLLAVYNAWRYYQDPTYRILHQGADDPTAYKTSRDTQQVLMRHPLTRGRFVDQGTVEQWWVKGATDARNASMYARGIMSNVTSARADEAQNDDVEVPRNITNEEAREKLRYRLGEQTHILVPGARQLFIGTPHTHDSIYDEIAAMGADCLTIKLFEHQHRIEGEGREFDLAFRPEYVFSGIGKYSRLLQEGRDYTVRGSRLKIPGRGDEVIDCYAGCAWPERFDRDELAKRRLKTRTLNEWDSQYQLESKPVTDTRLDPDRMVIYDCEPVLTTANRQPVLTLGRTRLVGVKARWDCSLGKVKSDVSALAIVYTDAAGSLYWHRAIALTGDLEELDARGRLVGGQVFQLREALAAAHAREVVIETNGPGGFVPAIARKHLKALGIAVREDYTTDNKNKRILDAFEPPLSAGFLWAHESVIDVVGDQMRSFNPAARNQADDYLDAGAGAIVATPVRVGFAMVGNPTGEAVKNWSPHSGVHEVTLD